MRTWLCHGAALLVWIVLALTGSGSMSAVQTTMGSYLLPMSSV